MFLFAVEKCNAEHIKVLLLTVSKTQLVFFYLYKEMYNSIHDLIVQVNEMNFVLGWFLLIIHYIICQVTLP